MPVSPPPKNIVLWEYSVHKAFFLSTYMCLGETEAEGEFGDTDWFFFCFVVEFQWEWCARVHSWVGMSWETPLWWCVVVVAKLLGN